MLNTISRLAIDSCLPISHEMTQTAKDYSRSSAQVSGFTPFFIHGSQLAPTVGNVNLLQLRDVGRQRELRGGHRAEHGRQEHVHSGYRRDYGYGSGLCCFGSLGA